MDKLIQYVRELGLEGKELQQFIEAQQNTERDERAEIHKIEISTSIYEDIIRKIIIPLTSVLTCQNISYQAEGQIYLLQL